MAATAPSLSSETETFEIAAGHEIRIELDHETQVAVTVRAGEAEVFGTPLVVGGRTVVWGPQKIAVYTIQGATVEVQGSPDVMYVGEETPMSQYINIHDTLQTQRDVCKDNIVEGNQTDATPPPRVMLVGPTDSGKSTLCKILTNYAVRCGSSPLFVDLDIGQGSLTVPGCVAACGAEHPVDVEEAVFPGEPPVVFYCGSASPSENADLYRHCVERLADVVEERSKRDPIAGSSGIVVNTMGWVEGLGYDLLLHAVKTLKINTVIVVGQDRLHSQLKRSLKDEPSVHVVKVAKSDGVVLRSKEVRQEARQRRVEEYYYGLRKDLHPTSQTSKIEDLQVYRVGGGPKAPSTALPIGATSVSDPLKISKVSDFRDVLNCMLAVSHAKSPEELLNSNIAGFIYVQDVDMEKGTVTYLSPRGGALPNTLMLAGTYRTYLE